MDWKATKKYSDRERWLCIYPAYIDSKKSRAEGRRIPTSKAVENPSYQEIRDVLAAAGLTIGVENKLYPRERSNEPTARGRIRVHFRNDDGEPLNPKFPTRDSLLLHCGETIPKLKSRSEKGGRAQDKDQQASGSQGGHKKKGKKR